MVSVAIGGAPIYHSIAHGCIVKSSLAMAISKRHVSLFPMCFPPSFSKRLHHQVEHSRSRQGVCGAGELQRKKEAHTDQPHLRTSEGDPHMSSRTSRIPWPVLAHLFAGPNLRPLSGAPLCGLFNCGEQVSRETLWFVVAEGLDFSALFFSVFWAGRAICPPLGPDGMGFGMHVRTQ